MVADEEENIAELVKAVLEQEGFKVYYSIEAERCLNILEELTPDLLLIDMMAPLLLGTNRISGLDIIEKVRTNPKISHIKIIVLSSVKPSDIGWERLRLLNISDYIAKPFDNGYLVDRVKAVLSY